MTPSTGWSRELLRSQTLRHPLMPRIPPFVLLIAASFAGTVNAQATENSLTALELEATYPEPFSYLRGVRELSNGLILAADPISQVLVRFDMDTGTADTLGREGAGPQEYDGPDRVFALPGDSTLLVDLGNGRFIVIDPEGTFVDWIPMSSEDPQWRGRQRQIGLQSVDESGNLYFIQPRSYSYGGPDSNDVRRLDRATGTEARVASQWFTKSVMRTRGSKPRILKLADDWAVGGDGHRSTATMDRFGLFVFVEVPDEDDCRSAALGQIRKEP